MNAHDQRKDHWNHRYLTADTPWDENDPSAPLQQALLHFASPPRRLLEIGCGTGANALWMAEQGYEYYGLDIAEEAVRKAKKRLHGRKQRGVFFVCDLLDEAPDSVFDVIADRGCWHCFDEEARHHAVRIISNLLMPSGYWISMIGNDDYAVEASSPFHGAPRMSARDILTHVEPYFEVHYLTRCWFSAHQGTGAYLGWCIVAQRRAVK